MKNIVLIGSGASGVHFALSVLRKGYSVTLLDVGWEKPEPVNPADTFQQLKVNLKDPSGYFLGDQYESVIYPGGKDDYYTKFYGFPPSKSHVFNQPKDFNYNAEGMVPLFSFAQGGLAEAWTGGAYPLNDHELAEFPFEYSDIEPHYGEVAGRIGLIGEDDDLARFYPLHDNLLSPLELDTHSAQLLADYESQKSSLNRHLNAFLGRSRVTTLSEDKNGRKGCVYCGRCMWGCPPESLYTPSITLRECRTYPNLKYIPGIMIDHFEYDSKGTIRAAVGRSVKDGQQRAFEGDVFVLAAGTLSSSKIFMDSIYRRERRVVKLSGLMDNRQILIPFLNLKMIGKTYSPDSYQYHQIAIGIESERPEHYIHGQVTTLKTALTHPIIQNIPLDLGTSIFIFRNLRAGLGVVNLNLFDDRRESAYVSVKPGPRGHETELEISYQPSEQEPKRIKDSIKTVKKFLRRLGCIVPPGMVHVRPMGASVHYSGTLPMSRERIPFTTSPTCRSHDFDNLYIVDGSTMPYLPAKNITFTLMANAVRVAETAF